MESNKPVRSVLLVLMRRVVTCTSIYVQSNPRQFAPWHLPLLICAGIVELKRCFAAQTARLFKGGVSSRVNDEQDAEQWCPPSKGYGTGDLTADGENMNGSWRQRFVTQK